VISERIYVFCARGKNEFHFGEPTNAIRTAFSSALIDHASAETFRKYHHPDFL
jgi:hypothetical protein